MLNQMLSGGSEERKPGKEGLLLILPLFYILMEIVKSWGVA